MNRTTKNGRAALGLLIGFATSAAAAQSITPNNPPLAKAPPVALSQRNISDGEAHAYRPWFENGAWQGDLIEYSIAPDGSTATDVDLTTSPPTTGGSNWSARLQLDAIDWDTGRRIVTMGDNAGVAFRWDKLPDRLKNAIDPGACKAVSTNPVECDSDSNSSELLNFLRGERDNEGTSGFRRRYSRFGDIINSTPVFVGAPDSGFNLPGYEDFRAANSERPGQVYVGANDGMLHAIDAQTGREVFAYIPSMLASRLRELAAQPYLHSYFVDGPLSAGDANFGSERAPDWRTVLVGGLGAGGKGLFALDITQAGADDEDAAAGKLLWELDADDDEDLGYTYSQARIAKVGNLWYAILGNGYGSASGAAKLYMVALATGDVTRIDTGDSNGNGLSTPIVVDTDGVFGADYAYAGDLNGSLWRFDLNHPGAAATRIFATGSGASSRAIIGSPDVSPHPSGVGYMVYFATGGVLAEADFADTATQSVYGIWDHLEPSNGANGKKLVDSGLTSARYSGGGKGRDVRLSNAQPFEFSKQDGWRVDLPAGERVPGDVVVRNKTVQFVGTRRSPGQDGAPPSFTNWSYKLDYLYGGAPPTPNFDLNGDSLLDNADLLNAGDDTGGPDRSNNPVALQIENGLVSQRALAGTNGGQDLALTNNIVPAIACTGNCVDGIRGGHFDVDTDTEYGGSTDGHVHEYDDNFNTTTIDYLNPEGDNGGKGGKGGGLESVDASTLGIDGDEKFIVVIANADLSSGGQITIGSKTWNVVEYQKMVQQRLAGRSGDITAEGLTDADGDSLLFDINTLRASKFELTFSDRAILDGGLIPTQTKCVKDDLNITNGRWRNGALTIHLIPADNVDVVAQHPTDLRDSVETRDQTIVLREDTNGDGQIDREYGGLLAANAASLVYESTVFWHYDGVCYGKDGYEDDVAEQTRLAIEAASADQQAPDSQLEQQISDLKEELRRQQQRVDDAGKGKKAEEQQKLDDIQAKLTAALNQQGSTNQGALSSIGAGDPVVVDGTVNVRRGLGFSRMRIMWYELR